MALSRILLAWSAVSAWLIGWQWTEAKTARPRTLAARDLREVVAEALLVTLFGALWFASLGAGTWWLPFLLVGTLREWPIRSVRGAVRIARLVGAGGLLAWSLPS